MKNPFPGMNPYLQSHWGDVHSRFMVYACDQINDQLPGDLHARVEESLAVDFEDRYSRTIYPDVKVTELDRSLESGASSSVAVAEPIVVTIPSEKRTERHIEIIDPAGGRVVTAIELLSPQNKSGRMGRRSYRKKQSEYLNGGVNLVEIDLIRGGGFVLAVPRAVLPLRCRTPYLICTRRASMEDMASVFPVGLREQLPNIPIPLRPSDRDVVLPILPLLDECYRRGRYDAIDYEFSLKPTLSADDEVWVDRLLRKRGLRP